MAWTPTSKPTESFSAEAAPTSSDWEPEDKPAKKLLLETGCYFLLETGGKINLENFAPNWQAEPRPS